MIRWVLLEEEDNLLEEEEDVVATDKVRDGLHLGQGVVRVDNLEKISELPNISNTEDHCSQMSLETDRSI